MVITTMLHIFSMFPRFLLYLVGSPRIITRDAIAYRRAKRKVFHVFMQVLLLMAKAIDIHKPKSSFNCIGDTARIQLCRKQQLIAEVTEMFHVSSSPSKQSEKFLQSLLDLL